MKPVDRTEPVVTTTMFTPAEDAAWEVAVQRGLAITAADLRALVNAYQDALAACTCGTGQSELSHFADCPASA